MKLGKQKGWPSKHPQPGSPSASVGKPSAKTIRQPTTGKAPWQAPPASAYPAVPPPHRGPTRSPGVCPTVQSANRPIAAANTQPTEIARTIPSVWKPPAKVPRQRQPANAGQTAARVEKAAVPAPTAPKGPLVPVLRNYPTADGSSLSMDLFLSFLSFLSILGDLFHQQDTGSIQL